MYSIKRQYIGGVLIVLAVLLLGAQFLPVINQELRYWFSVSQPVPKVLTREEVTEADKELLKEHAAIVPADESFGIVIPKIGANAKIIPEVDWRDSRVYQTALREGVAHAEGTSTPNKPGNMFLFSHSGVDFYEAARYNAEFYLLSKLETGDEIDIFYQGKKYTYSVTEKTRVPADQIQYITDQVPGKRLTLMTCWPAGTTFERLIIIAQPNI